MSRPGDEHIMISFVNALQPKDGVLADTIHSDDLLAITSGLPIQILPECQKTVFFQYSFLIKCVDQLFGHVL